MGASKDNEHASRSKSAALLDKALDALGADVVHAGVFDFGTVFRERRLRRADLTASADCAMFANVLPKWDSAERILFPGPYGSETVAYDVASLRPYPFEAKAAALVADYTGPQAAIMPRAVLKAQIEKAARMGFDVEAAFEFEFIVLDEQADSLRAKRFSDFKLLAPDNRCWSGQTAATFAPFVAELEAMLVAADVGVHSLSVELGPGCFEATLRRKQALAAADDAAFFRMFTKAFCRQRNLTASFMAMLGASFPGLGGHVSVSLKERKTGRNAFAETKAAHGLSSTARSFLAGAIELVPDAMPMCAHTVNAYRRLAPGSWAPKTMSWAPYSYAAAVRTASETDEMTRLEFRLPGSDCNVFLTLALLLGAGLHGLETKLALFAEPIRTGGPSEIPEGVPQLPRDLAEATERMKSNAIVERIFGAPFVKHFSALCEAEHAALARAVSPAEVERYLEGG